MVEEPVLHTWQHANLIWLRQSETARTQIVMAAKGCSFTHFPNTSTSACFCFFWLIFFPTLTSLDVASYMLQLPARIQPPWGVENLIATGLLGPGWSWKNWFLYIIWKLLLEAYQNHVKQSHWTKEFHGHPWPCFGTARLASYRRGTKSLRVHQQIARPCKTHDLLMVNPWHRNGRGWWQAGACHTEPVGIQNFFLATKGKTLTCTATSMISRKL